MAVRAWVENGFNAVMVAVILYNLSRVPPLAKNLPREADGQRLLSEPGPLLLRNGTLAESGWSRRPVKQLNKASFGAVVFGVPRLSALKYRKIDEYAVFGEQAITLVVAYESALRSFFLVGRYDRVEKTFEHESRQRLGAGRPQLQDEAHLCPAARSQFAKGDFSLSIDTQPRGESCVTRLEGRLSSGAALDLTLQSELGAEAVIEATRISPDGRHWLHSFKKMLHSPEGPATAHISRGLTYYKSTELLGSAAARINGTDFALSFGILPAHNSTATGEDSFALNSITHKLSPLEIRFDRLNLLNGFSVQSPRAGDALEGGEGGRAAAAFVFRAEAQAQLGSNYLLVKNRWEVVFGTVSGWVSDEAGGVFRFEDVPALVRIFDLKG